MNKPKKPKKSHPFRRLIIKHKEPVITHASISCQGYK